MRHFVRLEEGFEFEECFLLSKWLILRALQDTIINSIKLPLIWHNPKKFMMLLQKFIGWQWLTVHLLLFKFVSLFKLLIEHIVVGEPERGLFSVLRFLGLYYQWYILAPTHGCIQWTVGIRFRSHFFCMFSIESYKIIWRVLITDYHSLITMVVGSTLFIF